MKKKLIIEAFWLGKGEVRFQFLTHLNILKVGRAKLDPTSRPQLFLEDLKANWMERIETVKYALYL